MADHNRRQAEKACQRAEEHFLAGNIRATHVQASRATRLCPSFTAAVNALAAVAARPANWRAVLGLPRGAAVTQDAVKKQFRRLSLLVHPDKNRSAAADGAFKLLRQACDALSAGCSDTSPYAAPDEAQPWWREQERQRAEAQRSRRYRPPAAEPRWEEPPCPYKVIYCPFCKKEFARPCGPLQERAGMVCEDCHRWLTPPWQKKPEPPSKEAPRAPPPPEKPPQFPCPAQCPECGTPYSSIVSVGNWCLQCKACCKRAMVNVHGPELATATVSRRA